MRRRCTPSFARTAVSRVVRAVDIAVRDVAVQGLSSFARSQDPRAGMRSLTGGSDGRGQVL